MDAFAIPVGAVIVDLLDNPGSFTRELKTESISTAGSKLNIFDCSTGDLFSSQLARQASSERLLLWPLDGEPIPNEQCISEIDRQRFPPIEQFTLVSCYFGDIRIEASNEANDLLTHAAYEFRVADGQLWSRTTSFAPVATSLPSSVKARSGGLSFVRPADRLLDFQQEDGKGDSETANAEKKEDHRKGGGVKRKEESNEQSEENEKRKQTGESEETQFQPVDAAPLILLLIRFVGETPKQGDSDFSEYTDTIASRLTRRAAKKNAKQK
ncbi:unnamed protein product [Didymodactylos carnosus]|uniref:Uncharacterized protein n=1 Tax=Didymodactylos carnosus TaxID=1234261 RepID=A0A814NDF6_9BILA|nr:unnamed protein product [Didymodactylos carnosus]CAF1255071.1 unnamed protein product [Didymodactylos carnosus]CAF3855655.1 unnamed protein product [Didymodactylos carnosus]CAF4062184.1 unnamed protein product [Didymodactylos carnosus]